MVAVALAVISLDIPVQKKLGCDLLVGVVALVVAAVRGPLSACGWSQIGAGSGGRSNTQEVSEQKQESQRAGPRQEAEVTESTGVGSEPDGCHDGS